MSGVGTPRHQARRLALLGAYSLGDDLIGNLGSGVKSALATGERSLLGLENYSRNLLKTLVECFNDRREEAMAKLDESLDFPLEDLPLVDRIVLVLAMSELLGCPDTPRAVVINEWVELSKEYGPEKGYRLVNAILDSKPDQA